MPAIEEWLGSLGLGEYASRFAENDIDFSILSDLTDQDLEKIGVASLGHRRKILRAIAALGTATAARAQAARAPAAATPIAPAPPLQRAAAAGAATDAERRYLTVMFCDLVGSTGIAAKLDAEEWRDLVGRYLDAASAAVTEMGGYVAKKLGDGLLALFGHPVAQENDAERAARAALAIQRALGGLNRKNAGSGKPELAARVGLDTGPAVVDAAGEVYGDVANIAARVQALAEPGAVLITARVQRQVAGLFVAEERGSHTFKGVPEPTALYRLIRASGGGRRSGQRNLTPLVGRDDEMTTLMRRWERARQGDGQLVMIVGEPGLGKSRLIEEFHSRLADTPHTWVEWSCSQLLQNTPLHPIAEWGRVRFGGADVPAERRLAELESSLAQVKLDPAEMAPLLAPLLDIPLPQERIPALAPEELRRRQLAALTNWVMAGAKVQPVVLAFEDLHWADPTTLDVLRGIAEQGALAPLLIVATTRPEFRPPWSMRSHHGTVSLAPLDRAQVRDMVAELSARHALPKEVVDDVAARTGGVPLFVEEVTRLLLERGGESGIQAIPPTLQQSLTARLDRLGPAREVAQMGSVIGRGFSYGLLRAVAGIEDAPLQAALEKLAEADIVLVQGVPPDSDYRFKHALIQDAAYENLLKSRRQVLHRRVAETLRDRFADTAAAGPEVLAHHFTQAGLTDAAIEWWGKAGDQALRRSAFQEAIAHLGKAIEMADKEGEAKPPAAAAPATATPTASSSQRLKLQTNLGHAMMFSRGFGADETKAAFTRAHELAAGIDSPVERFSAYTGVLIGGWMRGEFGLARDAAERFLSEAEEAALPMEVGAALRYLGGTCLFQGHFAEAKEQLLKALRTFNPERDREARFRFGLDTDVAAMLYLAHVEWQLGEPAHARELIEEAVKRAVESGHVPNRIAASMFNAVFDSVRRDAEAALRVAENLVDFSRQHESTLFLSLGLAISAWARARLGDHVNGTSEFRQTLASHLEQGTKFVAPLLGGLLAELEAEQGNSEQALTDVDAALTLAQETGEYWTDAFLHRIRGEILLKRDPANTAPAEEAFLTAIAIAQQQKAKSFELRAALSLAKIYQSTGRAADAHAALAPALEGFSPTPEFPEIAEAQTLLAGLGETDDVKNAAASRQRRLKLQTSYGQAMIHAHGYSAPETRAAFARARELTPDIENPTERFSVYFGLWAGHFVSGELAPMREIATIILREIEARPDSPEAAVAHRLNGATNWFAGNFVAARSSLERALAIFDPDRDSDLAFRFVQDVGVSIAAYLALNLWPLGEVDRARKLAAEAAARATKTGHGGTIAYVHFHLAIFEMVRRDTAAAARHVEALVTISRTHEMRMWTAYGDFLTPWSWRHGEDRNRRVAEMRRAIATCREQGVGNYMPFLVTALAEAEAEAGENETALATIDGVLAETERTGHRWFDAETHRARGEILRKRDPANTAPAEEAFLTAIAIAQQQKARSFELRAALSLAKLYQSAGRAADAHLVLAPALEGFSPTPEFPGIAEAQTLLVALGETEEVKSTAPARQRRLKLQTSYGKAMMMSRGFASEESRVAFTRAHELGRQIGDAEERFDTYYGLFISKLLRGEIAAARETALAFRREAESSGSITDAAAANRLLGIACLYQGVLGDAQTHISEALRLYDPERDRDAKFRFGADTVAAAACYLAHTMWYLGEIGRASELIEESVRRAAQTNHAPTLALINHLRGMFDMQRGDAVATLAVSEALVELTREHSMALYHAHASVHVSWARARLSDGEAGIAELVRAIAAYADQGAELYLPFYRGLLAELEGEKQSADAALTRIGDALALAQQTGQHWIEAFLHRIRGEILLKRDPANAAPAEEAFLTAIAIAQQQKAKSFELRAALSLAKLYQSTDRAGDAYAALAPALEGFAPTPEMPEIADAQALLAALAKDDQVSEALAKQQARAKLHVDYARAVQWGKGFAADETKAAFARAGALAAAAPRDPEYWALRYGRFSNFLMRGEFVAAHEAAASYLQQAQVAGRPDHVVNARRLLGTVKLEIGAFQDSREEFEALLANWNEDRDRALRAVTGADVLCVGWAYMAQTLVCLGEVEAAVRMSEDAIRRAEALDDFGARAFALTNRLQIDAVRGRPDAMREPAEALRKLVSEKATPLWELNARGYAIWARDPAQLDPAAAANEFGEIIAAKLERKELMRIYHWHGLIAQLQSAAGAGEDALVSIAKGLEIAAQTGGHCKDSYLYRVRGDVLAKRDAAAAETAYHEALRVAREQGARTFELQAALALAKLYQSTGRAADAHAVLVPALEGFAPTPEFPEIAEAKALLSTLQS